jgi:LmbE family N-acetylglucosaminyl deacetylase
MTGMATVVAFHAHPDDEVLLTGGTLARLAAEGHRTVVVVACCGGLGADPETRLAELRASAAWLGVARVVHLGYADSGHGAVLYPDPPGQVRFARADPDEAAAKLAALLREEGADLLLSYDPQGHYGHRDHVMVYRVGARAAQLAGPVRVLESTMPRELIIRLLAPVRSGAERLGGFGAGLHDLLQRQAERPGQRGHGEEGGSGDAAGLDLAQRFRGNARDGGDLGHAARPARLAQQHAEPLPPLVFQAAQWRSDHTVIVIPV